MVSGRNSSKPRNDQLSRIQEVRSCGPLAHCQCVGMSVQVGRSANFFERLSPLEHGRSRTRLAGGPTGDTSNYGGISSNSKPSTLLWSSVRPPGHLSISDWTKAFRVRPGAEGPLLALPLGTHPPLIAASLNAGSNGCECGSVCVCLCGLCVCVWSEARRTREKGGCRPAVARRRGFCDGDGDGDDDDENEVEEEDDGAKANEKKARRETTSFGAAQSASSPSGANRVLVSRAIAFRPRPVHGSTFRIRAAYPSRLVAELDLNSVAAQTHTHTVTFGTFHTGCTRSLSEHSGAVQVQ